MDKFTDLRVKSSKAKTGIQALLPIQTKGTEATPKKTNPSTQPDLSGKTNKIWRCKKEPTILVCHLGKTLLLSVLTI